FQLLEHDRNFRFLHARKFIRNELVILACAGERPTQLGRGQRFLRAEEERFEYLRKGHLKAVIPSTVEGSRRATLKITQRDPSTPLRFARDDDAFILHQSLPRSLPRFD